MSRRDALFVLAGASLAVAGLLLYALAGNLTDHDFPPHRTCTAEHYGFTVEVRRSVLTGHRKWRVAPSQSGDWTRIDHYRYEKNQLAPNLDWRGGYGRGFGGGFEASAYNTLPVTISGVRVEVSHDDGARVVYDLRGYIQPNTYGRLWIGSREVVPNATMTSWNLINATLSVPPPADVCR